MSRNLRLAVFVPGALAVAGGTLLTMQSGGGIGFMLIGALLIASLALEGRYGRPGAPTDVPPHAWQPTRERFVDDESGPLTGERRYQPAGSDPRPPGPKA